MATLRLDYDARNIYAQKAIDYILSLDLFRVTEIKPKKKKCGLEIAIEEVEAGKVTVCKDFDDFVKKINE